jgi:hypothetical protein
MVARRIQRISMVREQRVLDLEAIVRREMSGEVDSHDSEIGGGGCAE